MLIHYLKNLFLVALLFLVVTPVSAEVALRSSPAEPLTSKNTLPSCDWRVTVA